ncbi:glycosyltransferase family 39 protein [Anaeromyxobacter diazotrophicus]|uniref:Glycosyltransferase RgtA/B/C/D-like domain-containing protein n=1 Tax=Anaeromyxobacter diazotrophicus TaxID=2590199 RepID=A0A7I9VPQ0_9BACT|nr:glycosyltransferase family 39 protein [Anaeromyxobacter diazotrophicus]GEJ58119.1 hypothetical protein AMYX_28600 [Anaeromyxobacter diazotrophicus]
MRTTSVAAQKIGLAPAPRDRYASGPALHGLAGSQGVQPWGWAGLVTLGLIVTVGLWFRLRGLAAEGFADDEVHTWLIAHNYLRFDFLADELEHPILSKGLVAIAIALLPKRLDPELVTRLPNALLGGLTLWAIADLGRTLFGRYAGLLAAALAACSTTFIGYQRVAREDVLVGLALLLVLRAFVAALNAAAEGRARDARRWELVAAAMVGVMFAAKYYFFFFPIPLLAWAWTRRGARWQISPARWAALVGVAAATFLALDFPLLAPRTWEYLWRWTHGAHIGDRATSESILFMGQLYSNIGLRYLGATPPWFYLVFAAVKLALPTVILAAIGLGIALWKRTPSHRIVLVWMAVWYLSFLITGAKYGRYFTSVAPAFFLLAGHATAVLARAAATRLRSHVGGGVRFSLQRLAFVGTALLVTAAEAHAAVTHAPHYRMYVNALGGGDARVTWFFPHCDLFDVGFREAVAAIARRAEPNAEVCSETEWPARLYADRDGRPDLATSTITESHGCRTGQPCYVVVEPGRRYWHNSQALDRLAERTPWHVERVRGAEVARVYRLEAGESLFSPVPPTAAIAGGARVGQ